MTADAIIEERVKALEQAAQIERLMNEYVKALSKVNHIDARLEELWNEGDYKRRNKVIWGEWSKAKLKANKAESRLLSALQSHSRNLS